MQVIARFLLRLFQIKACRTETTNYICTRLAPYFSMTIPIRGMFPGHFFKLPIGHRRLMLDVATTMLCDMEAGTCADEFSSAVETSLIGQDELKGYWNQISRML